MFKINDKILLLKGNNNNVAAEKLMLVVYSVNPNGNGLANYSCRMPNGAAISVYETGNADEICEYSRKALKECLIKKAEKIQQQLSAIKMEIDYLTKYESHEDYIASKINEIIKNDGDKKKISEILKEFKNNPSTL